MAKDVPLLKSSTPGSPDISQDDAWGLLSTSGAASAAVTPPVSADLSVSAEDLSVPAWHSSLYGGSNCNNHGTLAALSAKLQEAAEGVLRPRFAASDVFPEAEVKLESSAAESLKLEHDQATAPLLVHSHTHSESHLESGADAVANQRPPATEALEHDSAATVPGGSEKRKSEGRYDSGDDCDAPDPSMADPLPHETALHSEPSWPGQLALAAYLSPDLETISRQSSTCDEVEHCWPNPPMMRNAAQRISRLGWLFSAHADPRIVYRKLGQFLGTMDGCEQLKSFPSQYTISGQYCEPLHAAQSSLGQCYFRINLYQLSRDSRELAEVSQAKCRSGGMRAHASAKRLCTYLAGEVGPHSMFFLQCTRAGGDTFLYHGLVHVIGKFIDNDFRAVMH